MKEIILRGAQLLIRGVGAGKRTYMVCGLIKTDRTLPLEHVVTLSGDLHLHDTRDVSMRSKGNSFDGIMKEPIWNLTLEDEKPQCVLSGQEGSLVTGLVSHAATTLSQSGLKHQASEMLGRVNDASQCVTFADALRIVCEYVDLTTEQKAEGQED